MAGQTTGQEREGLSLQTLIVAAVASGAAAVVVSHVWKGGTVIAAAMTPVIVAIVKEALQRPIQSDVVRRSAVTARRAVAGTAASRTQDARRGSPAVGTVPTPPPVSDELTQGDVLLTHPRRTYGANGGGRTRAGGSVLQRLNAKHLKVAIVTGLLAFVIALVVLTVPELVFGGAVTSGHSTTFFGGGSSSQTKSGTKSNGGANRSNQGTTTKSQPATPAQPSQTTPQSTQTTPQQTPSQQQAPPQQPPSSGGGTPAPQTPAPQTPTP